MLYTIFIENNITKNNYKNKFKECKIKLLYIYEIITYNINIKNYTTN